MPHSRPPPKIAPQKPPHIASRPDLKRQGFALEGAMRGRDSHICVNAKRFAWRRVRGRQLAILGWKPRGNPRNRPVCAKVANFLDFGDLWLFVTEAAGRAKSAKSALAAANLAGKMDANLAGNPGLNHGGSATSLAFLVPQRGFWLLKNGSFLAARIRCFCQENLAHFFALAPAAAAKYSVTAHKSASQNTPSTAKHGGKIRQSPPARSPGES